MLASDIFKIAMALIDEITATGEMSEDSVAEYRAKAPFILTTLQNEIIGIENRYRNKKDHIYPVAIEDLDQTVQVDAIKANTLLATGLAANLMLSEDKTLANFLEQRYEEMKSMFLKPIAESPKEKIDVYDSTLNY